MKLNIRAVSITAAILWAASILIVGIAHSIWGDYGAAFLEIAASLYPGYHASGTIADLVVGTIYGFVDGLIFGAVFAWLYNRLSAKTTKSETSQEPVEP